MRLMVQSASSPGFTSTHKRLFAAVRTVAPTHSNQGIANEPFSGWTQKTFAYVNGARPRISSFTIGANLNAIERYDEETLRRRDAILSAVGFAGNSFLHSTQWQSAMDTVLEKLGTAVGASRTYFFEKHEDDNGVALATQVNEWVAAGTSSQIENEQLKNVPWVASGMGRWLEEMNLGNAIHGLIADFPESERALLENQGIQSLVAMPVFSENRLRGFLGFDDCQNLREWSAAEFDALTTASSALGAAIDRCSLEQRLRFSQKMDAIGTLAAGVAHDFNNVLHAIGTFVSTAKLRIDETNEAQEDLDEALKGIEMANGLTRQLVSFSRKHEPQPSDLNVNDLVNAVVSLAKPTLGSGIQVSLAFQEPSPTIRADSGLISQVLLNLILNACQAMAGKGLLEIRSRMKRPEEPVRGVNSESLHGDFAVISIRDTGPGIPKAIQSRVVEPFFTTNTSGEGTGLGLSIAYGVVQESGGAIEFKSKEGQGTEFSIYLPASEATADASRTSPPAPDSRGTILVVDDDPLVLASTRSLLESAGYSVVTAPDGAKALKEFETPNSEIGLVISDTVMPEMDGVSLFQALMAHDGNVKVILVSGYAHALPNVKSQNLVSLQKPVAAADLLSTINRFLGIPQGN